MLVVCFKFPFYFLAFRKRNRCYLTVPSFFVREVLTVLNTCLRFNSAGCKRCLQTCFKLASHFFTVDLMLPRFREYFAAEFLGDSGARFLLCGYLPHRNR